MKYAKIVRYSLRCSFSIRTSVICHTERRVPPPCLGLSMDIFRSNSTRIAAPSEDTISTEDKVRNPQFGNFEDTTTKEGKTSNQHHFEDTLTNESSDPNQQLIDHFKEFLSNDTFDQDLWSTLATQLQDRVSKFDDHEICILTDQLDAFYNKFQIWIYKDKHLQSLVQLIIAEMTKRTPSSSTDRFLTYFKCLSKLPMHRAEGTEFMYYIVRKKLPKILKKDKATVLECLRLMNECDLWRLYYIPKYLIELFLHTYIDSLPFKDLSTVLCSLTKTKTVVNTPHLLDRLSTKVINEPELTDHNLTWLLQFLSFQLQFAAFDPLPLIVHLVNVAKQSDSFNIKYLIGIAELCCCTTYIDLEFFEILGRAFSQNMTTLSQDKLKTALSCFAYFDSDLKFEYVYLSLIKFLQNDIFFSYILQRPKTLIFIVYHLCKLGLYRHDLLNIVLSEDFLARICGKQQKSLRFFKEGNFLFCVDRSISLECPQYAGSRLKVELVEQFEKYYCFRVPALLMAKRTNENFGEIFQQSSSFTQISYELRSILFELLGGDEFVHSGYLLTHLSRPNLLFAMNKQGVQQKLPPEITKSPIVDHRLLDKNLSWYTISMQFRNKIGWKLITVMDEILKVRQLKKIAVNVISIILDDWKKMTDDEKKSYLRTKIFQ